jgi:hypothetical protein
VIQYLRSLGYTHGVVWSEQGTQLDDDAVRRRLGGLEVGQIWFETWPDERTIN